jgi:hypothetical protein
MLPIAIGTIVLLVLWDLPIAYCSCSGWATGTMTGYDILSTDNSVVGGIADYTGCTDAFVNAVPVVAILERDWSAYKYHNIQINYNGNIQTVQSWDYCADSDCGGCCTANAAAFADPGFLLDVDKATLNKLFGIADWSNTFARVQYQICDAFDPTPIANQYNLQSSDGSGL